MPVGRVRWIIAALLFGETILNYLDLQTLSVLAPHLTKELGLSNIEYARIGEAFQLAYLFSFAVGGWVIDKLGVRLGLGLSIFWWSLAAALHGFADSTTELLLFRFLLGLAYPGAYIAAAKAASEWYPPQERGFITGVYTSGATVGATIAPPLIAWLALTYSWRDAFFVTGAAGLVYSVCWFLIYRSPAQHPWLSEQERRYILGGRPADEQAADVPIRRSLPLLLHSRYFWAVVLGRMIGDTPWIFYVMWLPKFLSDTQGLDLRAIGYVAWVPFLFSDFGSVGGGWLSGWLIRRGASPIDARLKVMLRCAMLSTLTFAIYYMPSTALVVALMSLMMLSTMAWMVNLSTIPVDVFPKQIVGTAVGLTTVGAVTGQLLFTHLIGQVVERYSYRPLFFIMSVLPPLAYLVVRAVLPRTTQVQEEVAVSG